LGPATHRLPQQICPDAQHRPLQSGLPLGHSHRQVLVLKICPPLQKVSEKEMHRPPQQASPGAQQSVVTPLVAPGQATAQAQWKSGPQKCVQHCASEVQFWPGARHLRLWLAAASGTRTTESTAPAAAATATLRNVRREVLVASALPSSSNLSSVLIAVPPGTSLPGGNFPVSVFAYHQHHPLSSWPASDSPPPAPYGFVILSVCSQYGCIDVQDGTS
jgi:hypothetical protein